MPELDLTVLAIPGFVILMLLEGYVLARSRSAEAMVGYENRDTAASLAMGVGNVLIAAAFKGVSFGVTVALASLAPWKLDSSSVWTWIAVLIATRSTSPTCVASCPTLMSMPSTRRRSATGPSFRSEPVTVCPMR